MDPSAIAGAALMEGVKFLYQQAGEFLSAWRARRRDKDAPPPRALDAPPGVTVTEPRPLADPPSEEVIKVLEQLKNLAEPIQSGRIDAASPVALAAIGQLRDLVEAALQAPIQLAGERQRYVRISDVRVVAAQVAGRVDGLRADLDRLPERSEIDGISVEVKDVKADGSVSGVELT
jgi:hypothetical protein